MMHYLLILLIGYLLGCSNMAVYLAAAQNVDLRSGGSGTTALLLLPLSAIIIYKHRDNLVRICRGTEIGLRSAHRGDHRKSTQSGPPRP